MWIDEAHTLILEDMQRAHESLCGVRFGHNYPIIRTPSGMFGGPKLTSEQMARYFGEGDDVEVKP